MFPGEREQSRALIEKASLEDYAVSERLAKCLVLGLLLIALCANGRILRYLLDSWK